MIFSDWGKEGEWVDRPVIPTNPLKVFGLFILVGALFAANNMIRATEQLQTVRKVRSSLADLSDVWNDNRFSSV